MNVFNEKTGQPQRPVAGRRHTATKPGAKGSDGEEDSLTRMGVIYNKIWDFSIVTRYILFVLPLAIIIAIPIIIGATAAQKAALGGVRIVWIFSWLEIVWLSLWVSKLVAKALPSMFQFLCGIVSSGTRKYAMVLKALEIYLSLCGWALASLATFVPIMTRNPTQRNQAATYTKYNNSTDPAEKNHALLLQNATGIKPWESIIQKILAAFLVASLILLAEKLLIQLISIGYHRTQFNAKITDSKRKIYLLSLLYDASRRLFPAYCPEFSEEDYIINDAIDFRGSQAKNNANHARSGSATPMRLIQNIGRVGDKLTSAFGNIAHEVTGKQVFNPDSAHSIVVEALEKNKSSEALAKRLWMSFVVEGRDALYLEDIVEVLGADRHAEADEAFAILDRDSNGDISLDEMILTVCEFGKERHSIANSLHDVDQAINVLDGLLCTIVFIVSVFIFVAFLNSSLTTTLATAGTALLSLSFVFATTAQEVLGSCIFLFVKHPFDVLDRVDVGDDQLVVTQISLLSTVFKRVKDHKQTQVPNIVLNSLWIQNITRSEAMREQLFLYIDFGTTLEDIQLLRNEMQAFVQDKENARDFQPEIEVEVTGIAEMNKMELKVEIRHKSNWSNETVRAARRSKFMCALVLALRKIPINAPGGAGAALGSADQPSYSVSISDDKAAANRDAFTKSKEAKRLVPVSRSDAPPKNTIRGATSGHDEANPRDSATPPALRYRNAPASESTALNNLNSRHPAADTARNPNDLIEPTTPKSITHSVSGTVTPTDYDRAYSIEEFRDTLRRQSTRGKRKASVGSQKGVPFTSEKTSTYPPPPSKTAGNDYDPYAYTSPPLSQPQQQTQRSPAPPPKDTASTFPQPPPATAQQQLSAQAHYHNAQLQNQQRAPPPTSAPRQAPQIQPPSATLVPATSQLPPPQPQALPKAALGPSNLPAPNDPPFVTEKQETDRASSPVRNPFQLHALREQAQGRGVPQMRRPVPGSGNSFAVHTGGGGEAVRPPRGDSLLPPKEEQDVHVGEVVRVGTE